MIVEAVRMSELTEREEIPEPKLSYATCSNQEDETEPAME